MKVIHWLPLAGLVFACAGQGEQANDTRINYDTLGTLLTVEELPPTPSYPEPRGGRLVTVTAGDYEVDGTWEVDAGLCDGIGALEMYAGPSGFRMAFLLRIPEGSPLGTYPVVAADVDFPDAPAALIAVQVFKEPDALGFQAYTGELELSELGTSVSGRFSVTLREIAFDVLAHFVGVFEDISVEMLSPEYCQALQVSDLSPDAETIADSAAVDAQ